MPENESRRVIQEVKASLKPLESLKSAKGYAKVKIKVKGQRGRFEEAIVIQLPFSFRFETLDDFGQTRFLVLSDGGSLEWKDFSRKEEGSAPSTEEEIRKFIPLAESLPGTLGLFMGKVPPQDLSGASVLREGDSTQYRILFPRGEMLWDSAVKAVVFLSVKGEGGRGGYRYEAGEFKNQQLAGAVGRNRSAGRPPLKAALPFRIRLKDLKTKNEVDIHYLDLEINPVISKEAFEKSLSTEMNRRDHVD